MQKWKKTVVTVELGGNSNRALGGKVVENIAEGAMVDAELPWVGALLMLHPQHLTLDELFNYSVP